MEKSQMSFDLIEQEIVNVLTIVPSCGYENWWGIQANIGERRKWTLAVISSLGAIGRRHGYSQFFEFKSGEKGEIERRFVIEVLTKIQEKLGQTLYDNETDRFALPQWSGEWLYDLIWLQYDIDYENIHLITHDNFINGLDPIYDRVALLQTPLVLESEWDGDKFGNAKEDFEKLLQARSKYKVMVFTVNENKNKEKANQLFNSHYEKFKGLITQ